MSSDIKEQVSLKPVKKSLLKRWCGSLLVIITILIVAIATSGCGSTAYELALTTSMSRQDITDKFGKPDEVVQDDADGYIYIYNEGFSVTGDDKGATEISLQADAIKKNTSDTYKIMDVTIGSSFDENVKRLGDPDLSTKSDGQKGAMYITKEDFILVFMTGIDTDSIGTVRLVNYSDSFESMGLDLCNLLGSSATENEIKAAYKINSKSSESQVTSYDLKGFDIVVNNESNTIQQVIIAENSIFNLAGVRLGSTLDKAREVFGEPISTMEGVLNTTQYTFNYDDSLGLAAAKRINVTVDNETGKVDYLEANIARIAPGDSANETVVDNTSIEPQEIEPKVESNITEPQDIEPDSKDTFPQWNTTNLDALRNGNIPVALSLLETTGDITTDAKPYAPNEVFKDIPKYIGQVLKITGTIENPENWELNSDIDETHTSTNTYGLLITSEDFTPVYVFYQNLDGFDNGVNIGDKVTVYGYLVGDNIIGPYETYDSLILVGNPDDISIE